MTDEAAKSFTVRLARPDDRSRIIDAIARMLRSNTDPEKRHRWLYEDNPSGAPLSFIAEDAATGEFAGVTSLFPWRIAVGDRDATGALGGDGFVYPRFRRRGIATALHGAAREAMQRAGIEVMFGMPRSGNVTPLSRHETCDVFDVVRYARPVSSGALRLPRFLDPVLRRALRPSRHGLVLDELRPSDTRVDAVWERTRPELGIATVRDSTFYDWQFRRVPDAERATTPFVLTEAGRPVAACALERRGPRVCVRDLLAPRIVWDRALAAIIAHARESDFIEVTLARPCAEARRMWSRGFLARNSNTINVMVPKSSPHGQVYFDASRWFFTSI
jgi:GNAT superfamily N-acetyltransferase